MDFEILIEDILLKPVTETVNEFAENESILSLINDFEDKMWRYEKFQDFVWDNIALTALSAKEREHLSGRSRSSLKASAKNLRLIDKPNSIGKGSELAEIVLYGVMQHYYKALPVVPKIFYKQNVQDNAKGADSVHIVIEGNDDFSLWFGEAKFYSSLEDTRLSEIVTSVRKSLDTKKLKKENSIITNVHDLDILVNNPELVTKIKDVICNDNSIDLIKPKLHVPIFLLHECCITEHTTEMNNDYREKIRDYHIERASTYFSKQIRALSKKISHYSKIKFHIILFPVPDKEKLITNFTDEVSFYKR